MKLKALFTLPLLITALALVGCQKGYYTEENGTSVFHAQKDKYQLNVDVDEFKDYCKGLPKAGKYLEGLIITFKLVFTDSEEFYPYLNSKMLEPKEVKDGFREYEFRMPSKDSTLEIGEIYYGKETSIKEVVPALNNLKQDDIKSVQVDIGEFRTAWGPDGYDSGSDKYSEDARDIEYNYSILSLKQLKKTSTYAYDQGPTYKVVFTLNNKVKMEYSFECRRIKCAEFETNPYYYYFLEDAQLPKIQHPSNI